MKIWGGPKGKERRVSVVPKDKEKERKKKIYIKGREEERKEGK
jgi:hypothetical protein